MNSLSTTDIIVLGSGPAGGTAALFAARVGRSVLLLAGPPGGSLIGGATSIDNYPGLDGLSGSHFLATLKEQCLNAGVQWIDETAQQLRVENRYKIISDSRGKEYPAKALIIATGTKPLKPAIENLERFWGKGASVCAWCDGPFFKGKKVAIFGSGNTAFASAEILSRLAAEVHILLPKGRSSAFTSVREKVQRKPNVNLHSSIEVEALEGNSVLTHANIRRDGLPETISIDGFFLALGQKPNSRPFSDLLELSRNGFILADNQGKSSAPGIFAAGDIIADSFRQLTVACGSGSIAALSAEQYLKAQWNR